MDSPKRERTWRDGPGGESRSIWEELGEKERGVEYDKIHCMKFSNNKNTILFLVWQAVKPTLSRFPNLNSTNSCGWWPQPWTARHRAPLLSLKAQLLAFDDLEWFSIWGIAWRELQRKGEERGMLSSYTMISHGCICGKEQRWSHWACTLPCGTYSDVSPKCVAWAILEIMFAVIP